MVNSRYSLWVIVTTFFLSGIQATVQLILKEEQFLMPFLVAVENSPLQHTHAKYAFFQNLDLIYKIIK